MHNSPTITMGNPSIPETLKPYKQFVVWKLVPQPDKKKPTKVPFDANTGGYASVSNPITWSDYDTACRMFSTGEYNGLGFVFSANDPFAFIDIDDCYDPISGGWKPHAENMLKLFPNTAWETSQSGAGLHAITLVSNKNAFLNKCNKWKDLPGNKYEFYVKDRFVAFGKCNWSQSELHSYDDVPILCCVPDKKTREGIQINWIDAAEPDYSGPADDDELIRRALESKGGPGTMFGTAASFATLWNRDEAELGKFFPDSGNRSFDNNSGDLALANRLAWWTGRNPARIERLMSNAPLCQREKWHSRAPYRKRTIEKALSRCTDYIGANSRRKQQIERDKQIGDDLSFPTTTDVITREDALEYFVLIGNGSYVVDRRTKKIRQYNDILREYSASLHPVETGKIDKSGKTIIHYGADLVVECAGSTIIIQCKYYSQPIGVKAVQEAFSAMTFYNAHKAAVVSNQSYTKAARQMAEKNNVVLLHVNELDRLSR